MITMHRICPVCRKDTILAGSQFVYGSYVCANCGYSGGFFLEMDDDNYRIFQEEEGDESG